MITMYTTSWCGDCRVTKRVLEQKGIAFTEVDIEQDSNAAEIVMKVNNGKRSVPTLAYNGHATSMSNFSRAKLDAWLAEVGISAS
jgi:mycoredoxin